MKTINPAGDDGWIKLKNKYEAKCHNCHEDIPVGESILWKKGIGVKHTTCEAVLEEVMPDKKIEISDKEWKDFEKYSYKELQSISTCQCCGISLTGKDVWISDDRKICEKCHI